MNELKQVGMLVGEIDGENIVIRQYGVLICNRDCVAGRDGLQCTYA